MASQFSNSGDEVLSRKLDNLENNGTCDRISNYDVDLCVSWIQNGGHKKVALQFPDSLLNDAPSVALAMKLKLGFDVYILADTTFGSCCADEVAAEHICADALIHFGHSCLSHTERLPVLCVLPRMSVNLESICTSVQAVVTDSSSRLVLICDIGCAHGAGSIFKCLRFHFPNIINAKLTFPPGFKCTQDLEFSSDPSSKVFKNCSVNSDSLELSNLSNNEISVNSIKKISFHHRTIYFPAGEDITNYTFIFVGHDNPLVTCLSMHFAPCTFLLVNPSSGTIVPQNGTRNVTSRSGKLELVRDAHIIGILVGTLGVARYREAVARLKMIIRASGKRSYTFVMGKPNEPKLANVAEVEVFVYVACPESTLVERSHDAALYRKLVTPWELELALIPDRPWELSFESEFVTLLEGGDRFMEIPKEFSETISVSLLSNKTQAIHLSSSVAGKTPDSTSLTELSSQTVSLVHQGGGGEALMSLSWQGLDPLMPSQVELGTVVEGRKGIASGYCNEADDYAET